VSPHGDLLMINLHLFGRKKRGQARPKAVPSRWQLPRINVARFVPVILSTGAVVAGALALVSWLDRPLTSVVVSGPFQRVAALDVERAVRENLHGGFLTANLVTIQKAVEKLPWADHARVQRHWPDGLYVQVTEQVAAARWGKVALVNTRGEVFAVDARHIPEELPLLDGPPGSETQVAELYFQLYPRLLEAGLRATALTEDARGAWQLELANGVLVRFGRRQLNERVDRFLKAGTAVLANRGGDISVLDMRYSNGFAVGWRTQGSGPAAQPAPAVSEQNTPKEPDNDA
jgi:cell division protein FtsQ